MAGGEVLGEKKAKIHTRYDPKLIFILSKLSRKNPFIKGKFQLPSIWENYKLYISVHTCIA